MQDNTYTVHEEASITHHFRSMENALRYVHFIEDFNRKYPRKEAKHLTLQRVEDQAQWDFQNETWILPTP